MDEEEVMLTLRDIMTRDVVTVPPDVSVRAAIGVLTSHRISGVPVVAGNDVIGVISTTDILRFASALPGVPAERPVDEESDDWEPVVGREDGEYPPAAYFSELWSDVGAELEERFDRITSPEWDPLEEHTVSEAMTRHVCKLPQTATVAAAADYMQRMGIHRVLVMDGGRLLGIVTVYDIANAVAERQTLDRRSVFDADTRFDERGWT
jgi:CBS domain-containing protein